MSKPKFKIDEITLVLIVALIAMIVGIYEKNNQTTVKEAEKITDNILENNAISLVSNGVINEAKLTEIKNMDYEEIKKMLNIDEDFCIYIEDENGNVILNKGSAELSKDGVCK